MTACGVMMCARVIAAPILVTIDSVTREQLSGRIVFTNVMFKTDGTMTNLYVVWAEEDGDPTISNVQTIKVTNGTLTDNGDGTASLSIGSGGGGSNLWLTGPGAGQIQYTNDVVVTNGAIYVGGTNQVRIKTDVGYDTVLIGKDAGDWGAGTASHVGSCVAVGNGAAQGLQQVGGYSILGVMVGYRAGYLADVSLGPVLVGERAGQSSRGYQVIFIGSSAGKDADAGGSIFIGSSAGDDADCPLSFFAGYWAGLDCDDSTGGNIGIGYQVYRNGSPNKSVAFGLYAGYNSDSTHSLYIGYEAGYNTATPCPDYTTAIGYRAGYAADAADQGVWLGYQAGRACNSNYVNVIGRCAAAMTYRAESTYLAGDLRLFDPDSSGGDVTGNRIYFQNGACLYSGQAGTNLYYITPDGAITNNLTNN